VDLGVGFGGSQEGRDAQRPFGVRQVLAGLRPPGAIPIRAGGGVEPLRAQRLLLDRAGAIPRDRLGRLAPRPHADEPCLQVLPQPLDPLVLRVGLCAGIGSQREPLAGQVLSGERHGGTNLHLGESGEGGGAVRVARLQRRLRLLGQGPGRSDGVGDPRGHLGHDVAPEHQAQFLERGRRRGQRATGQEHDRQSGRDDEENGTGAAAHRPPSPGIGSACRCSCSVMR
jgi:hypothetical protein